MVNTEREIEDDRGLTKDILILIASPTLTELGQVRVRGGGDT